MTIDDEVVAITARKKALVFKAGPGPGDKVRGATLTPVGTEAGAHKASPIPDLPGAYMAQEGVEAQIRQIRAAAAALELTADALELAIGKTPEQHQQESDAMMAKAREREADRKAADAASGRQPTATEQKQRDFARDYGAMQQRAQAATFASRTVSAGSGSAAPGWVCPEHGATRIKDLTSRGGRAYRACDLCGQYEKGR